MTAQPDATAPQFLPPIPAPQPPIPTDYETPAIDRDLRNPQPEPAPDTLDDPLDETPPAA